jgi:hypothetical protein
MKSDEGDVTKQTIMAQYEHEFDRPDRSRGNMARDREAKDHTEKSTTDQL